MREVVVQDEQNPAVRILLADPFETLANLLFRLILGKADHALTVKRIEPDRWFMEIHQRSFIMRIIDVPQPVRIVPRLWMCRVEKPHDSATVCTDIVVNDPAFLLITLPFVVRLIGAILVENVFSVIRP
ncbi:hypothetical protein Harman_41840 [Haloarcula mannanilytica]|uniref:Uncharacterized protein n=1 Tax=Haloarcula mannanilytica TaxID=2509225 RepID=A0A4C2EVK3_9EURY|nr:hypothetical protein Harman_41840 [Haloarcula mannanilytica]